MDISSFPPPVNRQNNFVGLNPIQNKFFVSFIPEANNNQDQVLPDSGSGQEKTEEEEEEYTPRNEVDNLAKNNNI